MIEKSLKEFLANIEPYLKLWGATRVSGIATNLDGAWFNVAIRVEFIESKPFRQEIQSPVPHFLYYVVEFPTSAIETTVRRLVLEGRFELPGGDRDSGTCAQILMKRERETGGTVQATPVQWSSPMIREAGLPGDTTGQKRTSISLSGYGQSLNEVLNYEVSRKIETRLRNATPCYDGFRGLYAHILPGVNFSTRDNTLMEVVAELPFELRNGQRDSITIDGATQTPRDSLLLRCFYGPAAGLPPTVTALQPEGAEKATDNRLKWSVRPPWPEGSVSARVGLFFEGEQVQMLDVKRWPSAGNLRQLVDTYFDPTQERLKNALLSHGSMNQQGFEWGVTRLLNLLGLPAIWYGKGAAEAKPDLGGYVEGGPVLLAECTLEKPLLKFSGLAERAKQLREHIGGEAEVLGVVFTRADTVDSEKEQAREHSLVLVGHNELLEMLKLHESGAGTHESIAYLRELRSNLRIELGALLDHRWPSRW